MSAIVSKVSSRGQVVVPASIREQLGIKEGMLLSFSIQTNGSVLIEKVPDALDWNRLMQNIPVVDVNNQQEVEKFIKDWE